MSRAFELLERVQQDQDLFRVPPVTKETHTPPGSIDGKVSSRDSSAFAREEVLKLVQCLFLATNGNGRNVSRRVVFCGIDDNDGSNLLCARVGRTLSEQVVSQVCVVDANLQVRGPSPLFDLFPADRSLQSEYGSTQKSFRRVTDNLCLLSSESITADGGPRTLDHLQALVTGLSAEFMYWVISSAPIGLYGDAMLLGQIADGVILVLEANATRWRSARKAKEALEDANVRVLGTVLNNRTFPIPEKIYRML